MNIDINNTGSKTEVKIGNTTVYFSYNSIIAFRTPERLYISENVWSVTTAKHLNQINKDLTIRLDNSVFLREVARHDLEKITTPKKEGK